MRIRTVKPQFFKDDELAEVSEDPRQSRDARLMYVGLWCMADREGKLEYRPKKIKAEIFPYDDDITPATIQDLVKILWRDRFLVVYMWEDKMLIKVRTFLDHQHVNHREAESELPDPDEEVAAVGTGDQTGIPPFPFAMDETDDQGPDQVNQRQARENPGKARAERKGREGKGKEGKGAVTTSGPDPEIHILEPEPPPPAGDDPPVKPGGSKKKIAGAAKKSPARMPRAMVDLPFDGPSFSETWDRWKRYRKDEHGFHYKSADSETVSLEHLKNISDNNASKAIDIIINAMNKGWKGLYKTKDDDIHSHKKNNNGQNKSNQSDRKITAGNKSGYRGL